jgi:hypothetical protein
MSAEVDIPAAATQSDPAGRRLVHADRFFAVLLALGGLGHAVGSYRGYATVPISLLWAMTFSLFIWLIATLHLVRTTRRGDTPLALVCVVATIVQCSCALAFGFLIGKVTDPRVMTFLVIGVVLVGFAIQDMRRGRSSILASPAPGR